VLIQQCNAADDPRLQVKCIGTLECLAQTPSAVEANQVGIPLYSNETNNLLQTISRSFPITCYLSFQV